MKKLAPVFLTVALTTAILIGCDFVDSNTAAQVESDQPTNVEARFHGHYTIAVDTTGNEDPEDMDGPHINP